MQYCAAIIKDKVDHCVLTWIGFHYISENEKSMWIYVSCECMYINDIYMEVSLEGYILKILTGYFWVVGWGNDTGMSKEKS